MNTNEDKYKLFCGILATLYLWRAAESLGGDFNIDSARKARDEYLAKIESFDAIKKASSIEN